MTALWGPAAMLTAAALWAVPPSVARTRVREWRRAGLASGMGASGLGRLDARGSGESRILGSRRALAAAGSAAAVVLGAVWSWSAAVAAVVVAVAADRIRAQRRKSREAKIRDRHLVLALEVIVAELKVGAHPGRACAIAAEQVPTGAVSARLASAAAQAELGGAVSTALEDEVRSGGRGRSGGNPDGESSGNEQWERIAAVWAVAEQRGIALAGLLDAARKDLVARASMRSRAEAGLAGARSTALVLAVLPLVGVGFGYLMGARPLAVLTGGGLGSILLVAGTVLDCAGLLWAERIGKGMTG